ncbi:MAG: hypothetical protein NZ602_09735 [Thermoguttaceae bacterium]|nr:hypothetical protein [Thermoguttaceae bacterium]MDW8037614.1 hypothetical protein [Thermoguttaceae bacterium]
MAKVELKNPVALRLSGITASEPTILDKMGNLEKGTLGNLRN